MEFKLQRRRPSALSNEAILYEEIGRLKVELDWLKKNLAYDVGIKRKLIDDRHPKISISRQCELLGISRGSYYYQPLGESEENLHYMRLLDQQYLRTPFYGVPKMTQYLRSLKYHVNPKRVRRLMRKMGLEAIYCERFTRNQT